jgi:hypothetical protein
MGMEYIAECHLDWDRQSEHLRDTFMDWVKDNAHELNAYEINKGEGSFKMSQYRGVDFTLIQTKLKELHKEYPEAFFEFTSGVWVDTGEGFYFRFEDEEAEE